MKLDLYNTFTTIPRLLVEGDISVPIWNLIQTTVGENNRAPVSGIFWNSISITRVHIEDVLHISVREKLIRN